MESTLPEEIVYGAKLDGNEYGWNLSSFPDALTNAEMRQYACLGGQFQFHLESGVYEMYWLNVDSNERLSGEGWGEYCQRSCAEVGQNFERLVSETDVSKQTQGWPDLRVANARGVDLRELLVFVAYFVNEPEWLGLQKTMIVR
jgi:hypothetical protein